jgi:hypothetical protein
MSDAWKRRTVVVEMNYHILRDTPQFNTRRFTVVSLIEIFLFLLKFFL